MPEREEEVNGEDKAWAIIVVSVSLVFITLILAWNISDYYRHKLYVTNGYVQAYDETSRNILWVKR